MTLSEWPSSVCSKAFQLFSIFGDLVSSWENHYEEIDARYSAGSCWAEEHAHLGAYRHVQDCGLAMRGLEVERGLERLARSRMNIFQCLIIL
jgi:hypothetical protein